MTIFEFQQVMISCRQCPLYMYCRKPGDTSCKVVQDRIAEVRKIEAEKRKFYMLETSYERCFPSIDCRKVVELYEASKVVEKAFQEKESKGS